MNIVIRADGSREIGTGHIVRCLTLATAVVSRGARATFITRNLPSELAQEIKDSGHALLEMQGPFDQAQDADETRGLISKSGSTPEWLVVDHYGVDAEWEKNLRSSARKIAVIDDLANRPHDCDLLFDQNFYLDPDARYRGLVSESAELILGPCYALLREQFYRERRSLRIRTGEVSKILVFFGGADSTGETLKVLEALAQMRPSFKTDIIIGKLNPHAAQIEVQISKLSGVDLHCGVKDMAGFMAQADISLGAGGSTTWERCFLGLPTITLQVADNQQELTLALAQQGVIRDLGSRQSVDVKRWVSELEWALSHKGELLSMSNKALALMGPPPASGMPRLAERLTA
jgi:UDP-2,4-diacetamido-2,4,6-trideoxy-beta-L-altropyranose hydrolase